MRALVALTGSVATALTAIPAAADPGHAGVVNAYAIGRCYDPSHTPVAAMTPALQ